MKLKKIGLDKKALKQAENLYISAFPIEERAPFRILAKKSTRKNVDFWGIYENDKWCGFMYNVKYNDLIYVFYFAVEPAERGRGVGTRALSILKKHYSGKRFFLAVEQLDADAPNYQQRLNRRKFYADCGFINLNSTVVEGTVTYDLLGIGGSVSKQDYSSLISEWMGPVMKHIVRMEVSEN